MKDLSNEMLQEIISEVKPLIGKGKVADYIPALAQVNNNQLGIAVYTLDGRIYHAGDASTAFSIQSISKALSLTLALSVYEEQEVWSRVGKEPSGQAFNSLVQLELEHGIPRNPFINAGALVISDLLADKLITPRFSLMELIRHLSHNPKIQFDKGVARSEFKHSARNSAIAYLMKDYDNFKNQVETVLKDYFQACSIKMNCIDLAKTFSFLANRGTPVGHKETLISPKMSKQINALLATCGLYDEAGDFAYRVGMPGKSGVGGGIIAVIPGEMSICVWSPELNESGNSLAGIAALELLTNKLSRSIF
ncbi:L-glutaminase [Pseudoalteromonas denitrificans DSM 6059]|uniref:Glutaminase n=2 Tax=Pseudoalteromonas TaxID=53246 RepID=A0A1I1LZG9_9GAMM|nr:glutaminase B [Pseudoalteromonas denitrificans]SFC77892.1 L-glutaminase [Pseudoalteromonas denitrificans DSM 6059]